MTKSRLLGERVENLEQEMWNKDAENASLKSQICKLNEMVAEEQQKTYQEQVNLYHEQVKTYNEWEEKQKEIEKNKILQEKLSKVEEELLNIKTRTIVENDTDLMDSSDSEVGSCEMWTVNDRLVSLYCLSNHDMICNCNQFWIQIVEGQALKS